MKKNCSLPAPIHLRVAQQEKQDTWDDFLREVLVDSGLTRQTDDTIKNDWLEIVSGRDHKNR